ncbi:WDR90 [Scenedesmus sp. PABB004]|nr:WDR90 [Scenedesmus sp. PABB004]
MEAAEWQGPVLDLFRHCGVEARRDVECSGRVAARMDPIIHRRVYVLTGAIPAVNYLKLPKGRASLGAPARFLYLQKKVGCVQLELREPPPCWTLLALDLAAAVAAQGPAAPAFASLSSLQLCSTLTTLPREMVLCHSLEPSQLAMVWLPGEPVGVPEPPLHKAVSKPSTRAAGRRAAAPRPDTQQPTAGNQDAAGALSAFMLTPEASAASAASADRPAAAPQDVSASPPLGPGPRMRLARVNGFTGERASGLLYSPATDELVFAAGAIVVAAAAGSDSGAAPGGGGPAHAPGQRCMLGHSSFVSCLALGHGGTLLATGQEGRDPLIRVWELAPPLEQQVQAQQQEKRQQDSEDKTGGVCLAVACAHSSRLVALDVSQDGRLLIAAGCDAQGRQALALWDIAGLRQGDAARLLVRQVVGQDVRVLAFSPHAPATFLAAGRGSVRSFRVNGARLAGVSMRLEVPLDAAGQVVGTATAAVARGPHLFTALAFDAGCAALALPRRYAYAATAAGAVLAVDLDRRAVVAVYQLHGGAVNALSVGEGLALTGSDDRTARLWPLDFTAPLLEAEHEAPVTGVALCAGGLGVAAGCEDGLLGLLSLPGRSFAPLLRSHVGPITAVAAHAERPEYATAAADGSVRAWDASAHAQLCELRAGPRRAGGEPCCVAYRPGGDALAVGYACGALRLFDVATTALLAEVQAHAGAVAALAFMPDGRLISCGADGRAVCCDAARGCAPLKALLALPAAARARRRAAAPCAAASADGALVAVAPGAGGGRVSLLDGASLERLRAIDTGATGLARLEFSADGAELWALTAPLSSDADEEGECGGAGRGGNDLLRFAVADGALLQALLAPHGDAAVTCFALGGQLLATGGADQMLRLWLLPGAAELAAERQQAKGGARRQLPPCQRFTGHTGPVTGVALLGEQLVTTGQDGNVLVWEVLGAAGAAQQPRAPHPDANVTARSWLERAAPAPGAGAPLGALAAPLLARADAAAAPGALVVPELQAAERDAEVAPSALYAEGPPSRGGGARLRERVAGAQLPLVPAPARCSALLGFGGAVPGGLLWLRGAGAVAHVAGSVIVLTSLADNGQSLLAHHAQPIGALALSPDATLLASASGGPEPASGCAEVVVWDVATRRAALVLAQHPAGCSALAFSPDGAWLASAGGAAGGGLVVVWDLGSGQPAAMGRTQTAVAAVAWLPWRGTPTFLSAGQDGLLLWSLQPRFLEQRSVVVPGASACAAFTALATAPSGGVLPPDGVADAHARAAAQAEAAATAFAADDAGRVWALAIGEGDLAASALVARLGPEQGGVTCLQWSQCSSTLAVGTGSGALLRFCRGGGAGAAGQWWARCGPDGAACWRQDGALALDGGVTSLALEPEALAEGVAGSAAGTAWCVDLARCTTSPLLAGHAGGVAGLVDASAAGLRHQAGDGGLVASLCADGSLTLWRTCGGAPALPLLELRSGARASAVAFDPGAAACVVGYADGALDLVDLGGQQQGQARAEGGAAAPAVIRWSAVRHASPVVGLALQPGAEHVMAASRDGLITVTHAGSGRLVSSCRDFTGCATPLHAFAVHGGAPHGGGAGAPAAAAWLDRLLVFSAPWAAAEARVLARFECPEVPEALPDVRSCVAFVPGSANLLLFTSACLGPGALLYDFAAAAPLRRIELPGHAAVASVAVCPRGALFAFGRTDGRTLVTDACGEGAAELRDRGAPGHPVAALAFTAGGRQLVSAAGPLLAVWDA